MFDIGIEPIRMSAGSWNADACADLVVLANERKVQFITGTCTQHRVDESPDSGADSTFNKSIDAKPTGDTNQSQSADGGTSPPAVMPERATEEPTVKSPVIQLKPEPLAIPVQDAPDATLAPVKTVAVGAVAWPSVVLEVGHRAELKVVDALGQSSAFAAMGGPPGFIVRSDGSAIFTPKITHVGRWRVSVRLWENGTWGRRGGFELVIRTAENTSRTPTVAATTSVEKSTEPKVLEPNLAMGCDLGFGFAVGGTDVRDNWAFIDQSFQGSGSPMVSFSCRKVPTAWSGSLE